MEVHRQEKNKDSLFYLKDFDLELSFVVKQSAKNKAELKYEVVTLGTESEKAREKTLKITLHMQMLPATPIRVEPSTKPIEVEGKVAGTSHDNYISR